MEMLVPLYMQAVIYVEDNAQPTLAGFIQNMERTLERGHRRSIENEDGTLSAADAVKVGEVWRLYEFQKSKLEANRHKL